MMEMSISLKHRGKFQISMEEQVQQMLCQEMSRSYLTFDIPPSTTADLLKQRVEAILNKHQLEFELDWQHSGQPYLTERGMLVDIISSSITEVCGFKPNISTTGGTSDGRFIAKLCDQVVEFGPINESIHKINEHVDINTIDKLKDIYKLTLKKALS